MGDIYFWRQFFILLTCLLHSLTMGFTLAFPAVLGPAITSPNSTDIRTTANHASWIAAVHGVGGFFGAIAMGPIMQTWGRKISQYSRDIPITIGWILMYFAKDIYALYAARIMQGISAGGIYTSCIVISEYVHPCRRGYFIIMKKVIVGLGILCCHTMGNYITWQQIAIFPAVPCLIAAIMTFFTPESPSYLALKGRFSECEKSFRWLHGTSEESESQLKVLLEAQRVTRRRTKRNSFVKILKAFQKKEFQKALLMSSVLTLVLELCGKLYFIAFVNQIMKEILGSITSATVFTLGVDIFTLFALILSSVVICLMKRRTLLISSGVFAVFLMLLLSVLVYLKTVFTFSKYMLWFTAVIIVLQCFIINIGISPASYAIIGEIFPLEHKGLGACVSGVVFTSVYATFLKIVPVLIDHIGLHGMFAIFGVFAALCFLLLYKTVPETKDRTLQDIEDELKGAKSQEAVIRENERLMH